jgi:hypothetical protein
LSLLEPEFAGYYGSWNKGFDHAETLSRVKCPAVVIHANWFYDENGILMGAMDADDAATW